MACKSLGWLFLTFFLEFIPVYMEDWPCFPSGNLWRSSLLSFASAQLRMDSLAYRSTKGTWSSWTGWCPPSISNTIFGISGQSLHWKGLGVSWCSRKKAGVHSNCYWQAVLFCRICLTWVMAAALSLLWSIWRRHKLNPRPAFLKILHKITFSDPLPSKPQAIAACLRMDFIILKWRHPLQIAFLCSTHLGWIELPSASAADEDEWVEHWRNLSFAHRDEWLLIDSQHREDSH